MSLDRFSTIEEIRVILSRGIVRPVSDEKREVHFGTFTVLDRLLSALKVDGRLGAIDNLEDAVACGNHIFSEFCTRIKTLSSGEKVLSEVFDYLAEEDPLTPSDVVFVFGSRNLGRARKAGELLDMGLANWGYFSGSRPLEDPNRAHEGRMFRNLVLAEFGISSGRLIADPYENSLTMVDNVRGFLNYLDSKSSSVQSLIMVSTPHTLRRGWAIFNKYLDSKVKLIRCGSGPLDNVQRHNWFEIEEGARLVFEEYLKLRIQQINNNS